MAKTAVDPDEDALALAMAHDGTTVKREAVNRALREVSQRREQEPVDLEEWVAIAGPAAMHGQAARTDCSIVDAEMFPVPGA
ncbi:MAG TPA: type II toxin-antitoxin system VapB family antitoxin [Pseudonocardiaceae bacterium]|jgi:Arc/MetJ family transcription regulator|nr:type II toxin-antitoxin system VapB family antitoxin [Pseudonocardiaceae bacterium]